MGKTLIEKHLLQPKTVDGIAQVDGPEYYVYRVDETGNKELVDVVVGDVKEAVRRGETALDLDAIEMAFRDNPHSFDSVGPRIWDTGVMTCVEERPTLEIKEESWYVCVKDLTVGGRSISRGGIVSGGSWLRGIDAKTAAEHFAPVFFPCDNPAKFADSVGTGL